MVWNPRSPTCGSFKVVPYSCKKFINKPTFNISPGVQRGTFCHPGELVRVVFMLWSPKGLVVDSGSSELLSARHSPGVWKQRREMVELFLWLCLRCAGAAADRIQ